MSCSLSDPEGITACVKLALPWIEILYAVLQITVIALVGSLIWIVRKWRAESDGWKSEKADLLERGDLAERRSRIAERENEWFKKQLESGSLEEVQQQVRYLESKIFAVRQVAQGDSVEFWSRPVYPRLPQELGSSIDYFETLKKSIPIILFANQKGGVGKTTICADIAAYFSLLE